MSNRVTYHGQGKWKARERKNSDKMGLMTREFIIMLLSL